MTKKEAEKAYKAGTAFRSATELPGEALADPVSACPFPEGDPQRTEWLRGLADAVDATPEPATLRKNLDDAIGVASKAVKK